MDLSALLAEVLPGGIAGAAIAWLLRGWISERLKHSISHEYSAKLENLKNELNAKLESIKHEYGLQQLRTSLFFEHQRDAFAVILAKVAETNQAWWHEGYEPHAGLRCAVPSKHYRELNDLYFKHQLFLDSDCLMALDLLFEIYTDSFPFHDDATDKAVPRDPNGPYDSAEYVRPRLAALFQQKIGIANDARGLRQLALLGAIRIVNRYHFTNLELPERGALKIDDTDGAAEAVMKAERNLEALLQKMRRFRDYLQTETSFFHEAEASLRRYLSILERPPATN